MCFVFGFALVCFVLVFLIIGFNQGMYLPSALLKINSAEFLKAGKMVIAVYIHMKMKMDVLLLSSFKKKSVPFYQTNRGSILYLIAEANFKIPHL